MNNLSHYVIIGWETRSWRHREQALVWCKDYGFKPVTKHVFIGEIYGGERIEMQMKFKALFTKKTEKFFFAQMCRTCFNESMTGVIFKEKIGATPSFELIQMPQTSKNA